MRTAQAGWVVERYLKFILLDHFDERDCVANVCLKIPGLVTSGYSRHAGQLDAVGDQRSAKISRHPSGEHLGETTKNNAGQRARNART